MDGPVDEHRVVGRHVNADALGQVRPQPLDGISHALGNLQRVGLRLPDDAESDARLAVGAKLAFADVAAQGDGRDITEPRTAVDDDRLELLRRGDSRGGAHDQVLAVARQRPGRRIEGHGGESRRHVGHGQAQSGKFGLVDVDAEDLVAVAIDLHVGDTRNGRERIDDLVLDQNRHVLHAHRVRRHREPQHRLGISVGLDDPRHLRVVGKVVADTRDRVAHVRCRDVEIDAVAEFDCEPAPAEG